MHLPSLARLPLRLRLRRRPDPADEKLALRATLDAAQLLGLAAGAHLRELRASDDPLLVAKARCDEAALNARLAWQIVEILAARFGKIPECQRPYYSPSQRFAILELKSLLGWSREQAARVFLLCPNTLSNWETAADPETRTVGVTVAPVPPVRRFEDSVRRLVQLMARARIGGEDMIAAVLARAGWRLSARSVRRIARERPVHAAAEPVGPQKPPRPVVARFVHHVWMLDVTTIQTFLGGEVQLAGVFDAFSRAPLALEPFERRPTAADMARLLRRAAAAFGKPRYVITDLGGEFVGHVFRRAVARLGAVQRFASRENLYATARLERFWRTLKDAASLRLRRPLTIRDLERRLEGTLAHYLVLRPHQGLDGATPAEAFLGLKPARESATSPPRGRPGEGTLDVRMAITFLDPAARAFPYLVAA
ncbi:MAG: DDE-type integrase/transposase/recombinase [Vicinamibacteria bacterium]